MSNDTSNVQGNEVLEQEMEQIHKEIKLTRCQVWWEAVIYLSWLGSLLSWLSDCCGCYSSASRKIKFYKKLYRETEAMMMHDFDIFELVRSKKDSMAVLEAAGLMGDEKTRLKLDHQRYNQIDLIGDIDKDDERLVMQDPSTSFFRNVFARNLDQLVVRSHQFSQLKPPSIPTTPLPPPPAAPEKKKVDYYKVIKFTKAFEQGKEAFLKRVCFEAMMEFTMDSRKQFRRRKTDYFQRSRSGSRKDLAAIS
jgi:hypothetical protein